MAECLVIGSDTQHFESVNVLTGIQRVVHDLHVGLVDHLSPYGVDVVPVHAHAGPRLRGFLEHPYLADDPVLHRRPREPDEIDALLLLDVNVSSNLRVIYDSLARRPRPVIALIYDTLPLKIRDAFGSREALRFRLYLQQVLHLADHVVVTSRQTEDDLKGLGWRIKAEIHVIPLGSSFVPRRATTPETDQISLLNVSTIEPRKGHAMLVGAFDLLRRRGLDVDLTLIGRYGWGLPTFLDDLRHHADFGARLRWLDSPSDSVIATEARRCSIGVFLPADEGFGLFLEEGLALGLKMVVSDIPVLREREQPNLWFCQRTSESLAESILIAHRCPWVEPTKPIRVMRDFVRDFSNVVKSIVGV